MTLVWVRANTNTDLAAYGSRFQVDDTARVAARMIDVGYWTVIPAPVVPPPDTVNSTGDVDHALSALLADPDTYASQVLRAQGGLTDASLALVLGQPTSAAAARALARAELSPEAALLAAATSLPTPGALATRDAAGRLRAADPSAAADVATQGWAYSNLLSNSKRGAASGVASLDATTKVPYAQLPVGTAASTVAAGNDSRITGAQQTTAKGTAGGYASLDSSGKIPQAQLPAVALTEFLGAVASQTAMLALTGQRGDWATRTDLGTDWQLIADDPTALASWRQMTYPASPVSTVAGRTGAVTLSSADLTDSTATGRSVVTAATAAAARTALGAGTSSLVIGTTAGTAADGADSRITGAQQTSGKGVAGGYAGLDANGLVPTTQLPASAQSAAVAPAAVTWANTAQYTDWDPANFGRVKYGKTAEGRIYVQGLMKCVATTAFGVTLFTLPAGFRPTVTHLSFQAASTGLRFDVQTTGAVTFQGGTMSAGSFVEINIQFHPSNG